MIPRCRKMRTGALEPLRWGNPGKLSRGFSPNLFRYYLAERRGGNKLSDMLTAELALAIASEIGQSSNSQCLRAYEEKVFQSSGMRTTFENSTDAMSRAHLLAQSGDLSAAAQICRTIVAREPSHFYALFMLGTIEG